jgi:eukaryotic-like serine/threonine-protein kinase
MTGPDLQPPADLELDGYLEPFEAAAARGDEPDPADYLPPATHPKYASVLCELVRLDLEFAWGRGEDRRVEAYADRFPALFADPGRLAAVAAEEYRLRRAAGEDPDPAEYRARLNVELSGPTVALPVGPVWGGTALPAVGEFVPPGFRIRSELGRGAFGRVYLAEQPDLAGRLVAIKVSSRLVGEAQTLARLQHTHIVPVYAVHRVRGYQLLVMPFLGAATLADLVRTIRGSGTVPATGRAIRTVIASQASEVFPAAEPAAGPPAPADPLVTVPYADAILDFGIALADGLAHAHERGILHRDLKPANVLLTDDGRPMLLDFNLAADDRSGTRTVGGTPRYMAPEQLAALSDPTVAVDARADVYALGLVLTELLTGRLPFPEIDAQGMDLVAKMRADRLQPPRVELASPAVAAILRKCLAPEPAGRYATAAELRDDLSRHRTDRPLKHAREPRSSERFRKWARRHPRLWSGTTVGVIGLILLLAVTGAAYTIWRHEAQLQARSDAVGVRLTAASIRGQVIDTEAPAEQLKAVRIAARGALKPYEVSDPAAWQSVPAVYRLRAQEFDYLRFDLTELLFYAGEASGRLAARDSDEKERARLLDEAKAINARAAAVDPWWFRGPVERQRAWLERLAKGEPQSDAVWEDLRVRDDWLTGFAELRAKKYVEAARRFEKIVRDEPMYPAWMALGTARLRLGQFDQAADAFFAARAIEPGAAPPHFYRGVALLGAGRHRPAIAEFDEYITSVPEEPDARLNRAIAKFHTGDHAGALADLAEAERLAQSPARVHALRYQIQRAAGDAAAAEYKLLLSTRPTTADGWTVRAEAQLVTDPTGALADFDKALALEPEFLLALRGKASCLSEGLNRPADAAAVLDRVVRHPGATVEDRAALAVLLARLGRGNDARTRAKECLGPDTRPVPLYQAASALALTAKTPEDRGEVVAILRRVLKGDAGWAKHMTTDPDLKAVHADPAFRALVAAGKVIDGGEKK